jgi:hypothetical protein
VNVWCELVIGIVISLYRDGGKRILSENQTAFDFKNIWKFGNI